jgi:hypothetical protein
MMKRHFQFANKKIAVILDNQMHIKADLDIWNSTTGMC